MRMTRREFGLSMNLAAAGRPGGRLVVAQRSEPRTWNPVTAVDEPSRAVVGLLGAPLVRIHPETLGTEGVLAESWKVSGDGRRMDVRLRAGLRFSDGARLTAEDVVFTFGVHTDPKAGSPQGELLEGMTVAKTGEREVRFTLARAHALGERLLAGTAIVPRHRLEGAYREGRLASAWGLRTAAGEVCGAGPFRLKQYEAGRRVVLERNPHYWKAGRPYLDELEFAFTAGEDAQVARMLGGSADLMAGFGGGSYQVLAGAQERLGLQLGDAGPGLDYTFLLFNLNPGQEKRWWGEAAFRRAVSAAIDREAIVKLVYRGRGSAVWGPATVARKEWRRADVARTGRALAAERERARGLLRGAGFRWDGVGQLVDGSGTAVRFTVLANAGNPAYGQMAAVIEEDLKQIGIGAKAVPMEFRSLVDRVTNRRDFEAAILALRPGDADPAADMNVLASTGRTRLWNLSGKADRAWEGEIDRMMDEQIRTRDMGRRRRLFHEVQRVMAEQEPMVCLASPNLLYAAKAGLRNLRPGGIGDLLLWNADELYWEGGRG
jgi:peptide/nickel transport system substrate-binding protein